MKGSYIMDKNTSPYMSKIWLKSYDDYVKEELDFSNLSLADTLRESTKKFPNNLCYEFMGTTATYNEFEKNVITFANFLMKNNINKGDKIAINLPNCPQYLVALYGSFYAGCIVSGLNFLLKPSEIVYQLKDCNATVLLTMDSFYEENVRKAFNTGKTDVKIVITTNITDMMDLNFVKKFFGKILKKIPTGKVLEVKGKKYYKFKEILERYQSSKDPKVLINPKKDLAFLQYTGGTTGPPKGAMLTHFNELANIEQTFHWWEIDAKPGEDIYISGFPFFHLAGMFLNLGAIYHGAQQLLIPNPRDMNHLCELIDKWKPNLMANVPTLYLNLLNTPKFRDLDLSPIRIYISGAAPFPSKNIEEFEDLVGKHKLLEVYGMTEASPIVSANPYKGKRKIGTVGIPVSTTLVKIVDVENREEVVDLGDAGEIAIKGPQIFKGYWNKPEETKNALQDGWFFSGDVGIMDKDGYISIVDRTKDMINVSGFKVFSVEVDKKMSKHPAIEMASSIGVADPKRPGSEIVKLYVLLKDQYKKSKAIEEDIMNYARQNLAKYKVPKEIEIVEHIPLTSIGKIDKKALRMK